MDAAARYIDRVNAAVAADDLSGAASLAEEALRAGVKHASLIRLVAEDLDQKGETDRAIAFLKRGLVMMPGDPVLLVKLGALLAHNGAPGDALRMLGEASRSEATAAEAHFLMGRTLTQNADAELGRRHYERALEIAPDYVQARGAMALMLARIGEPARARAEAERTLEQESSNIDAVLALGVADEGERRYADAERRMRALLSREGLDEGDRVAADTVLADALHGQGRVDEAFAAFRTANEGMRALFAEAYDKAAAELVARIERLGGVFQHESADRWRGVPLAPDERPPQVQAHVFLVGFPRSGTTLLEQILAAHPDVVTLEEKPTLAMAEAEFFGDASGIDRLAALTPEDATRYRRAYWATARKFVSVEGKVFVDKMPVGSMYLPLVAKLFPQAKILFARRDPRDVVLSCFRHAFMINPMTYAFTRLDEAARFYDALMSLYEACRQVLPLAVHEVRYERLVADFEAEARAICAFIGATWDDAVRDFAAAAAKRTVSTPSAVQVRRGLYREGEGQWRAYAAELEAVASRLEPWIGPKGYPVG